MGRMVGPDYNSLTQDFLHKVLDFVDGKFYWKNSPYKKIGAPVGSRADHVMIEATGHMSVDIFPYSFSSARLAILYETGEKVFSVPKHKNGKNDDNRVENLYWKQETASKRNFRVGRRSIPLSRDEAEVMYELCKDYLGK